MIPEAIAGIEITERDDAIFSSNFDTIALFDMLQDARPDEWDDERFVRACCRYLLSSTRSILSTEVSA